MDTVEDTPLIKTGNKQQVYLVLSSIVELISIGCYGNYYHGDFNLILWKIFSADIQIQMAGSAR